MIEHLIKCYPQSKRINLVLSGTGALYPVHAGAVCALLELGYEFKAIAASSGGAIIGSSLCAGVSTHRLKRVTIDFDPWRALLTNPTLPFSRWGFYDNSPLEHVLNKWFKGLTFQDSPIPIEIIATQLSPMLTKVSFSKETSGEMPLAKACQISSAIPLLFKVVKYNETPFLDGGLADDLPITSFQDEFEHTIALDVCVRPARPRTFWQFLKFVFSLLVNERGYWKFSPNKLTLIPINVTDYLTLAQFKLTRGDRKQLFNLGYNAVHAYFSDFDKVKTI